MEYGKLIKQKAFELGFDDCGIAECRPLEELREPLESWLESGYDGGLGYMSRNIDKRVNPAMLVTNARSVIVCAVSYKSAPVTKDSIAYRIASYARTRDYHLTIKEKLHLLLAYIREIYPNAQGRPFVDTAPVFEKGWAVEAGLGWIGRNSLLIHPHLGSFILLGVIITDVEIEPDKPYTENGCKGCTMCKNSCPANAINDNRTINATKCISRLTIEPTKSTEYTEIKSSENSHNLYGWLFGCDCCQQVCPYNIKAPVIGHDFFAPSKDIMEMTRQDWLSMTEQQFQEKFGDTPLSRCGLINIQQRLRNME